MNLVDWVCVEWTIAQRRDERQCDSTVTAELSSQPDKRLEHCTSAALRRMASANGVCLVKARIPIVSKARRPGISLPPNLADVNVLYYFWQTDGPLASLTF